MSALIVILQATEIAPRATETAGSAGGASPPHLAATEASSPAHRAEAAATARNAKGAARSKLVAKVNRFTGRSQSLPIRVWQVSQS